MLFAWMIWIGFTLGFQLAMFVNRFVMRQIREALADLRYEAVALRHAYEEQLKKAYEQGARDAQAKKAAAYRPGVN